ncbi:Outer membrane protein romA [Fulvivirga imtechensis AK7]|uniref:Outer membrane protein romA n=1 Tax=Fulvivirga imtechensis AK7 TaxID=1237149 RepID=L8JVS6_9BACT|nr:MBL fold metallo-hydrolase [Fulvivirga imtechensis]ELR72910.1 Outer membrane protein romA [Fulvivirga imtechensis AK7]
MLWIIGAILLIFIIPVIIGMSISAPKHEGPKMAHFDGKQFKNPSGASAQGFAQVLKWMTQRDQGPWKKLDVSYGPKPPEITHSVRITFINHSSFLIQVDGVNILTDPVYSQRVSPFTKLGPQRMRPPGIRFEDLPPIDFVLISHNHYDHLDKPTVKRLYDIFQPMFVVPLGVDKYMKSLDIEKVVSLDWWQEMPLNPELVVASVPAQHFSGRGMLDRDATLWCGFVLKRADGNIYYVGDTGYDQNIFKEVGQSFAPIKLSLIPIGAYVPKWFMSPVHISPEEAVQVHKDINSQQSVAIHFGTFPLGDDGQREPVEDLQKALKEQNIPSDEFWVLEEGEGRDLR